MSDMIELRRCMACGEKKPQLVIAPRTIPLPCRECVRAMEEKKTRQVQMTLVLVEVRL